MRKSVYAAAMLVFGGLVYAGSDGFTCGGEPDLKICERALRLLSRGDKAGFDVLLEQLPYKTEDWKSGWLESQLGALRGQLSAWGEPCGIELVHVEEVGRCLRRYTYVCKYEAARIRWRFTYYRPADQWRLNGYDFDSDDHALIAECGRRVDLPENAEVPIAERPEATLDR